MKSLLILLCSLALATGLASQTELNVRMKSGQAVSGTLISLKGDVVKMRVNLLGGKTVVTHHLSDFEPASAWRIGVAANPPKDYYGHLAAAKAAAAASLLDEAGREAEAALKSVAGGDDYKQKEAAVHAWAADALEAGIDRALAENNLAGAHRCLMLLTARLSDQRSEEQLHAIAVKVEAAESARTAARHESHDRRADDGQRRMVEQHLKPIQKEIAKADKYLGEAIRKSSSTAQSAKLCDSAVNEYTKAWKATTKLKGKYPDDDHLAMVAAEMTHHIHDNAIRAALQAANVLTTQSDYKGAMDWAQRILAFEPGNKDAEEMVKTIQQASAAASGQWRWGWRTAGAPNRPRQR